jgi:hypothetical protein
MASEASWSPLYLSFVMAGLVPAIHALLSSSKKDVEARHEAGHDVEG